MKLKIKIQLGVFDKKPADMLRLQCKPEELLQQLDVKPSEFDVTLHKLADESVHLIEYTLEKFI